MSEGNACLLMKSGCQPRAPWKRWLRCAVRATRRVGETPRWPHHTNVQRVDIFLATGVCEVGCEKSAWCEVVTPTVPNHVSLQKLVRSAKSCDRKDYARMVLEAVEKHCQIIVCLYMLFYQNSNQTPAINRQRRSSNCANESSSYPHVIASCHSYRLQTPVG